MTAAGGFTAVSAVAATGAAITGLRAAWLWYRASCVEPKPNFTDEELRAIDPQIGGMRWTGAIRDAVIAGGRLNADAAFWTAVAVTCAAVQSATSFLATAFA